MKSSEFNAITTVDGVKPERDAGTDRYSQIAGDRVLLYLRCLDFPALQALDLAIRALREAERNANSGSESNPVVESMQALHRLLREQKRGPDDSPNTRCEPVISTSPIRRLHMISEETAPARLKSLFANMFRRSQNGVRNGNGSDRSKFLNR